MFDKYLRKIIPIPITKIETFKDGYKYLVYTYASVLNQDKGIQLKIIKRAHNNKRIKTFDGWYYNDKNLNEKYALVEFYNGKTNNN